MSSFYRGASNRDRLWIAAAVLMQPPLLLIDHGHFQFNAISLGLHGFGLALLVKSSASGKREGSGLADMMATVLICLGVVRFQPCLYAAPGELGIAFDSILPCCRGRTISK